MASRSLKWTGFSLLSKKSNFLMKVFPIFSLLSAANVLEKFCPHKFGLYVPFLPPDLSQRLRNTHFWKTQARVIQICCKVSIIEFSSFLYYQEAHICRNKTFIFAELRVHKHSSCYENWIKADQRRLFVIRKTPWELRKICL